MQDYIHLPKCFCLCLKFFLSRVLSPKWLNLKQNIKYLLVVFILSTFLSSVSHLIFVLSILPSLHLYLTPVGRLSAHSFSVAPPFISLPRCYLLFRQKRTVTQIVQPCLSYPHSHFLRTTEPQNNISLQLTHNKLTVRPSRCPFVTTDKVIY